MNQEPTPSDIVIPISHVLNKLNPPKKSFEKEKLFKNLVHPLEVIL